MNGVVLESVETEKDLGVMIIIIIAQLRF